MTQPFLMDPIAEPEFLIRLIEGILLGQLSKQEFGPDVTMVLLRFPAHPTNITYAILEEARRRIEMTLQTMRPGLRAVLLPANMTLEALNDQVLDQMGLQRTGPTRASLPYSGAYGTIQTGYATGGLYYQPHPKNLAWKTMEIRNDDYAVGFDAAELKRSILKDIHVGRARILGEPVLPPSDPSPALVERTDDSPPVVPEIDP